MNTQTGVTNLRKTLLLFVLLFSTSIFCQKFSQNIFTTAYIFPSTDSISNYYYLYKIPVSNLIFIKKADSYSAGIQITLEVSDSNSNFIQRHIRERNITYSDFESTVNPSLYVEGMIDFKLETKSIKLNMRVYDYNSQKEFFTKDDSLIFKKSDTSNFLSPILLNNTPVMCRDDTSRAATNFGNYIPFDNNSYDILIPSTDTTLTKAFVKIISRKDTIFNGSIDKTEVARISFEDCNNKVVIKNNPEVNYTSNFYLIGLTSRMKEGLVELLISDTETFQSKKSFKLIAKWLHKPQSLIDSENAIRLLKFIISNDSITRILKSGNNYDSLLNVFWKKSDPTPSTEHNELMFEYYERIDYCNINFPTISGLKGIETDRAKIYILFGKPNSVERSSSRDGKIQETWIYIKQQKKFIFSDERGIGEFNLKSAQ